MIRWRFAGLTNRPRMGPLMETPDRQPPLLPAIPVCGIGASAGGVEALQQFFQSLPVDLGLAYVVIVHLAADRKSELPAIIAPVSFRSEGRGFGSEFSFTLPLVSADAGSAER